MGGRRRNYCEKGDMAQVRNSESQRNSRICTVSISVALCILVFALMHVMIADSCSNCKDHYYHYGELLQTISVFRCGLIQYFRYIRGCLKIDPYQSVRNIISSRFVVSLKAFCTDLLGSMMDVAAQVPRFCKPWVIEKYHNVTAEKHGNTHVGKIENPTPGALPVGGHDNFAGTMDITCPREDNVVETYHHGYFFKTIKNTLHMLFQKNDDKDDGHYFFIEDHDQAIQKKDDGDYFFTEDHDEAIQQQHNANNHFPEHYNNANTISPKGDPIFVKDYEKKISETSSRGFQLHPHDQLWWVIIWTTLLLVGTFILILLILHRAGRNIGGDCSPCSRDPKQKSTRKTKMELSEYGRFIDYVDISLPKEGSPSKEVKITPVRRSLRIRNKSASKEIRTAHS